jgi:hypothetical protein
MFRRQKLDPRLPATGGDLAASEARFLCEVSNGGQIACIGKPPRPDNATRTSSPIVHGMPAPVSPWRSPHVLVAFRGFHIGGAEIFPIYLANALLDQGLKVSMLSTQPEDERPALRGELDPRIAVYDTNLPLRVGFERFPGHVGIDLLSSHCPSVEDFFLGFEGRSLGILHVVSLHGHYESGNVAKSRISRLLGSISHWVYTAEKNLRIFEGLSPGRVEPQPAPGA